MAADAFGNALGNSIVEGMAPQPIGLTAEQSADMSRQVEAGYLASQGQFNDQLQRDVRQQQFQLSLQWDITRNLDNNPEFVANLPMPRAEYAEPPVRNVPRPAVATARDPVMDYACAMIGDFWKDGVREASYSGVDRQFAEAFNRQLATPRSGSGSQTSSYGPEIDHSLYVQPGFVKRAYDIATVGWVDPNAPLAERGLYFLGAAATMLPMWAEEGGRAIMNAPYESSLTGQYLAHAAQANDTDAMILSSLQAVSSASAAFTGYGGLSDVGVAGVKVAGQVVSSGVDAIMGGARAVGDVFMDSLSGSGPRLANQIGAVGDLSRMGAPEFVEGAYSLVGANRAIVDPRKLTEYALNPEHPVGGDKARVFASALVFNKENSADLMSQLRRGVMENTPTMGKLDRFGQRYTIDIPVTGPTGSGTVRSGWIFKPGSIVPELTTVYVR